MTEGKCECCGYAEMFLLKDTYPNDEPEYAGTVYRVCANCLILLTTHSLKPEHYKALLDNGHSPNEFLLHGDFYDCNGNAVQPML